MLGVGTSSKALAAGAMVPYCRTGVGAVASQSFTNPYLGIEGLTLLEQGLIARRALERLMESDAGRDLRQVAIVDRDGNTAAYTGAKCIEWAGQLEGGGYVCLGNILTDDDVVKVMAREFESSIDEELPERLLRTLEAGQEAGGDRRGRQSAGLRVVHTEDYPYCDVRVDDHPDPIAELRRVFTIFQREEPFLQTVPRRDDYTPHWETVMRMHEMIEASLADEAATAKER
jgi:uncharacterized Ntn-hydrolase superfamily protein